MRPHYGKNMKYIHKSSLLLLALATTATAQTPVQGPSYIGQNLDVTGEVLTNTGSPYSGQPCVQLKVLPDVRYSGGRVWVCSPHISQANLGEKLRVSGEVNATRLTKMGPARRVVPLIAQPTVVKKIK